jgi:alginate O-acetyltransferase complex protein AlgI
LNFNSTEFLFFLPIVLVLYTGVFRHERLRNVVLLVSSFVFYATWNWKYAGLLAFSTVLDYAIGLLLSKEERPRVRKALIATTLTVNLGLLAVFKYYNFFLETAQDTARLLGGSLHLSGLHAYVLLPVGISFYTFQTMSYTIDVYKRQIPAERSLLKFAVFVSFFPQLVAGPIIRASDFLPQLQRPPEVTSEKFHRGLVLVFQGLVKKIVLGDLLASLAVDDVFASPGRFSSWDLLLALYGYAFQIYNDFSGYSTIAIGLGTMMGFWIPENFNRPYLAQSPREFWSRWHISLSTFLRDYLYIPLGGNRGAPGRVRRNLFLTMLLGGLWHGAALHFVFWGAYHGVLLMFGRSAPRAAQATSGLLVWGRRAVCFHLVCVGWLLFRSPDAANLLAYARGLLSFSAGSRLHPLYYAVLLLSFAAHVVPRDAIERVGHRFARLPVVVQGAVYAGAILLLCGFTLGSKSFIYFQF